jgi:hypothetical protein
MRLQLASLIATAGLAGFVANAAAQDATTAPPPAPPPPPAAPATPPATPAPPEAPATATPAPAAAPADGTAAPAPAQAAEAPPAPPPPVLPTSGDGYEVIQVLNTVCEPGVKAGDLDARAKAAGFKKTRDGWVRTLGAKPYTVKIDFFSVANPNVCIMTLDYAAGGAQPIIDGLNTWAYLHEPFMQLYRNDEYNTDLLRRTISWEHVGDNGASTGLVFVGEKKPDGTAVNKIGDHADLRFQIRNGG